MGINDNLKKKVLVISPTPSHPQNQGNRARVYTLLNNLKQLGYGVYFAHISRDAGDQKAMRECWGEQFYPLPYEIPKSKIVKQQLSSNRLIGIAQLASRKLRYFRLLYMSGKKPFYTYFVDDWYDESLSEIFLDLAEKINPDIVIVEYVFFSKALECFQNNALKIIDTHDIFANRYKLYLQNNVSPKFFSTTIKQENKGLNRADIIFTIQQNEADILRPRLKQKTIVTVGHTVPLFEYQKREITNKILFVGSDNDINISAIRYFIDHVFSQVKLKHPDLKLLLVGKICVKVSDSEGCVKMGNVENLKEVYDMSDIVINPVRFGTGLKIKNIEALGYAKPLITTSVGADGIEDGAGKAFLVAESPDDYVKFISSIITDYNFHETLALNAYSYAQAWNQKCLSSLSEALEFKKPSKQFFAI